MNPQGPQNTTQKTTNISNGPQNTTQKLKISQFETIKNWGRTNVFRNGEKETKIPIPITM